jgi:hypothetical protein
VIAFTSEDNIDFSTTNDMGEYIITRVRKTDTCKVLILPDRFAGVVRENISVLPGQITKNVNFVLKPDLTTGVTGAIADPAGTAIANAKVFVSGVNGSGKATTDSSGRFTILGLASGTYDVAVMAQDYKSMVKANIQVVTGELTTVIFSLSRLDLGSGGYISTKGLSEKGTPDQIITTLSGSNKIFSQSSRLAAASGGCGPFGMDIPDEFGFNEPCCSDHDDCYKKCGPKGNCDVDFCSCLMNKCKNYNPKQGQPPQIDCYTRACGYCGAVSIFGHIAWFPACISTLIKGGPTQ